MNSIEGPKSRFLNNIAKLDELMNIGNEIVEITIGLLKSLQKDYEGMPAFLPYKEKLKNNIEIIENIKNHPNLKPKYKVIYNQALVLLISNFEAFLSDLALELFNNWSFVLNWPEQKISLDLSVFNYSSQTIGEVILRSLKEKYSFQDLQSTIKFFKDHLEIEINLKESLKENIILYQAQRHVLIHSLGKVDDKYLKQVRETRFKYDKAKGDEIIISEKDYIEAKKFFCELVDVINKEVTKKINLR